MAHKYFRDDTLPTECTWKTVILLQKGNRNYTKIRLIELIWKKVSGEIN